MLSQSNTKFYYPDGTTTTIEPDDGYMFVHCFQNGPNSSTKVWKYRKDAGCWINAAIDTFESLRFVETIVLKCECGSEAVGSNRHSTWCQKWSANS